MSVLIIPFLVVYKTIIMLFLHNMEAYLAILYKKATYFGYNHYMLCEKNKKINYILCFVLTCYTIYDTMNSLVRKGESVCIYPECKR